MKKVIVILLVLFASTLQAQKYKFGKVSKAELEEKAYPLDSTANAAILYSERKTNFEYTYDKGFYIVENYFVRLKIYNKEGFGKASKEIPYYRSVNGTESVGGIKAVTYNLVDGKITKTKLKSANVFTEEKNKYYTVKKFTMPNLKEGSIVEWKYTFETPFVSMLDEVELQEDIPIKKVYIRMAFPEYFDYKKIVKGFLPIPLEKDMKERKISYTYHDTENSFGGFKRVSGSSELTFYENIIKINKKNIPAIKEEPFSGNINNYKSGINFELTYVRYPNRPVKNYSSDWESVVKKIYFSSSFGDQLKKNKHFKEELNAYLGETLDVKSQISKTLAFVKQKIKWNEYYGIYSDEGVKSAYKKGEGNVADINLNLVAMLRSIGLDANPVLVSSVSHGIPLYPTRTGFNYIIVHVVTPDGYVLLDATDENSTPDVLPDRVLNFQGRLVKKDGKSDWISLFPSKHSIKRTAIKAKINLNQINGTARMTISNSFLLKYRNDAKGLSKEALIEWIDKEKETIDVLNARVSGLKDLNKNITEFIQYETESYSEEIGGKLFISPVLFKQLEENPFKSERREFPVFFNTPWADIVTVVFSVPAGYKVESLPESLEYRMPDDVGVYTFKCTQDGNTISVESNMLLNYPVVPAETYEDLKTFYKQVIDKQNEKIVLVKE